MKFPSFWSVMYIVPIPHNGSYTIDTIQFEFLAKCCLIIIKETHTRR